MTYDTETCGEKTVKVQITTPPLLRYGCLEMMFKTYGRCYVHLKNDIRQLKYYRPKTGEWVRVKMTLSQSGNMVSTKINLITPIFYLSHFFFNNKTQIRVDNRNYIGVGLASLFKVASIMVGIAELKTIHFSIIQARSKVCSSLQCLPLYLTLIISNFSFKKLLTFEKS